MASVEKRCNKSGTLISFRIHVFHGRDEFGKQLPPFIKTVRVPPELNARQIETLIRRGECAGIKLSAVDLRGKTITICSCVMYDPKNGVYEKPYPKKAQAAPAADYPADGRNPAPLSKVARRTAGFVRGSLAGKRLPVYQ